MSLTAFNRLRRMQQVEEMKPENIMKKAEEEEVKEQIIEEPVVEEVKEVVAEEEVKEETKTAKRRNAKK